MQPTSYESRRATLEDVPALRQLWTTALLPEADLEKRFTEFQVVVSADGRVTGAIGLHVEGLNGLMHDEAIADAALTDTVRPLLWGRVQSVARNRGLARLWTRESAPYWQGQGFEKPDETTREKMPRVFGDTAAGWQTLKLKDENAATLSPDHEFALFRDATKADSQRLEEQAKVAKSVAIVVAVIFLLLVVVWGLSSIWYVNYKQLESEGKVPPPRKTQKTPVKKPPAPAPAPPVTPPQTPP